MLSTVFVTPAWFTLVGKAVVISIAFAIKSQVPIAASLILNLDLPLS